MVTRDRKVLKLHSPGELSTFTRVHKSRNAFAFTRFPITIFIYGKISIIYGKIFSIYYSEKFHYNLTVLQECHVGARPTAGIKLVNFPFEIS